MSNNNIEHDKKKLRIGVHITKCNPIFLCIFGELYKKKMITFENIQNIRKKDLLNLPRGVPCKYVAN